MLSLWLLWSLGLCLMYFYEILLGNDDYDFFDSILGFGYDGWFRRGIWLVDVRWIWGRGYR